MPAGSVTRLQRRRCPAARRHRRRATAISSSGRTARSGPRPKSRSRRRCSSRSPSSSSSSRPRTPQRLGIEQGAAVQVAQNGTRLNGRAAIRTGVPAGTAFLAAGIAKDSANALTEAARGGREGVTTFADVNYFEPWWIQIIKALLIFGVIFGVLPVLTVYERKLLGRFQHRYGPNRVGPYGLLQPMAEIVKFARKEAFRPTTSVGFLFHVAPALSIMTAVGALALIPWGDVQNIFGTNVGLYGIDVSIGPLYVFALGRHLLLRDPARRLGLGLQVLVPRLDARRRAADLLRGRAGALAGRRADHRADAVAHRDRQRAGGDVVLHPAALRLPDLHGRLVRGDQPRAVRPGRGRRRARRRLLHRVRRHAASSPTCSRST